MFNTLNATLKKVVVIFLIIALTYANLLLIGENMARGLISYAVEEGEEQPVLIANQSLNMNKVCEINGEQKRIIQVAVESGIESEEYPIKETTLTLNTNIIEGTLEDVKVTNLNKNSYTKGTWVLENGKLKISLVNENETLESKVKGLDMLLVTYVFSNCEIETIKQPLEKVELTQYSGEALTKECEEENFEDVNTQKDLLSLWIGNDDIHKTTITDGQAEYFEMVDLDLSYRKDISNITIEDVQNIFYNTDGQENNEVILKYKTTRINKEELLSLLGEEGKLVITDNLTNKVLVELTKETIEAQEIDAVVEQKFTDEETSEEKIRSNVTVTDEAVKIEYVVDIKKFKLELINIKPQSESEIELTDILILNEKTILNINNVDALDSLHESIKYTLDGKEKLSESIIKFKDTVTRASLDVDNQEWVVGQANTVKYTITLDTNSEKSELYVNPMFLLELPSSVESINTAKSEFMVNNDNGAFVGRRVFVTTVLGRKFVVIKLDGKQTEETVANGNTTIDVTLELNVIQSSEESQTTKLYYRNDTVTAYESGKGFDTAEVTVSMIMESEPKDEIPETVVPGEGEITSPEESEDIILLLKSSTENIIKPQEELEYDVNILNFSNKEKQNLKLTCTLPEGISIVKVIDDTENALEYNFDASLRMLTINVDKLDAGLEKVSQDEESGESIEYITPESKTIKIIVKADNLLEGIYSKEIKCIATLLEDENILAESEEVVNNISDVILSVEMENLPEKIEELKEYVLGFKITNKGLIDLVGATIKLDLPEEMGVIKYKTTVYSEDGQEESTSEGSLSDNFEIDSMNMEHGKVYYFQITGMLNAIDETKTITMKVTINGKEFTWTTELINTTEEPETPIEPSDPENPEKPETPENPEDPENPEEPNNPSDPENPNDSENQGETENKTEGFDLSLKQYLNKITVTNSKGKIEYDYKDTDFAKIEIHSKQMNESKVTLEYKIVVKNEGTIPGYARKIVDYMPKDLTFNSELNPDWYLGDDGNIYSVKLIDKLLNPGETAEINIILEKQMTNENVGTVTNLVEIYEATNDEGVEDVNSIPGDKIEGQNDISKVEVLIVTSTGTIILYTTLVIAIITIIGIGFYKIRKVLLNKKGGC